MQFPLDVIGWVVIACAALALVFGLLLSLSKGPISKAASSDESSESASRLLQEAARVHQRGDRWLPPDQISDCSITQIGRFGCWPELIAVFVFF